MPFFLKVRNKQDNCFYALKRIPLNPKSTQFYRTIMREVQLISRLNHENVVRYAFNEIITDGVAFMHKMCVQTRNKLRWSA